MFDAHTTYRLSRVWIAYPVLGPLSVHFFSIFPEVRPAWARRRVLVPLYALGAALVVWRELVVDDPAGSDRASFYSAVMLSLEFACDLGLLYTTMRRGASGSVRNRAKSIFVGLALTCTASVGWQFASLLLRPVSADAVMILSACVPALIAYALLKRNLLDLDAVLRAGLIYTLATSTKPVGRPPPSGRMDSVTTGPLGPWKRLGLPPSLKRRTSSCTSASLAFPLETSMPGVFAAGDVRSGSVKRVASAVGEGAMAVQFVHEYLKEM